MTYQKMSDAQVDAELKSARQDLSKFRQSKVKQVNQIERIVNEAVKNKYHASSKRTCPVYANFRKAGFSNIVSDSMCKQAHRYGINPNLSPGQILNIIKAKHAQTDIPFKDNSTNSKGPGGVPDKKFPESSYGNDLDSCITSLTSIGVDSIRAKEECETQYAGKGSRGGNWYNTQGKAKNASIPAHIVVSGGDVGHLVNTTSTTNIKSAKEQREHEIDMYQLHRSMANHVDSETYVPVDLRLEKLVEQRGRELRTINEIRRIRSGAVEKKDVRPAWMIVSGGL
jgi:hypothetical protein